MSISARALARACFALMVTHQGLALQTEAARTYPPRNEYTITRASSPIRVDGILDEDAWRTAARLDLTTEWFPDDNTPAAVSTECYLTYDDHHLYVGFVAHDPDPTQIRAHYADRDTPFQDDTVGFMVDTFNDQRRAFQFRVNPLGVQMEAANSDVDGSEDWSWDIIWNSVGRIGADGYVVEIAIPFSQLRFPRTTAPQTWSFVAMRDYPRSVRHRLRSTYQDRGKNCLICQFEPVHGFERMESGRNLELDPTVTATQTDTRPDFPDGPIESGDLSVDAGLSARWSITPNMALSAALNPDFSQVEADAAQLNVNERFALFYPEKRPFFLEGADFFGTPLDVVFTRSIADPRFGLKLTGKDGSSAYGVFVTEDNLNNLIFPGFEGSGFDSIDEKILGSVVRYRRDVGDSSTIGLLYAGREGEDDYHNRVYGIDGFLRASNADTIRFQAVNSDTRYDNLVASSNGQPSGSFSGQAVNASYNHSDRNWFWRATYIDLAPDFRADSGFISRVGYKRESVGVQRTFWGDEKRWYRRLQIFGGADFTQQRDGNADEWGADLVADWFGPMQSLVEIALAPNREYYDGVEYDNFRQGIYTEVRPSGDLYLWLYLGHGETIDFANSRQARFIEIDPAVEFSLGTRARGSVSHVFNRIRVDGGQLLEANLTEARLFYHVNLRTFVRAILQYRTVDRNTALYTFPVDAKSENLFSQFLFSYKINPQTVFLAGYSDNYRGFDKVDLTQSDRSFFMKIGYAWLY